MSSDTTTARLAAACYLATHVTSIPALVLYAGVLHDGGFVTGSGATTPVLVGALFEVICALGIVGTAVALYPVVRRHSEGGAAAYVGLRTLEAGVILVGVVCLLAVVTLRNRAGADSVTLVTTARGLVAVHDWTFLLGPNFVCAADTTVLAFVMWRSRLVPRIVAGLGVVGGPMLFLSATAVLFGAFPQVSAAGAIAPLPVFAWELGLVGWLLFRGFQAPGVDHEPGHTDGPALAIA